MQSEICSTAVVVACTTVHLIVTHRKQRLFAWIHFGKNSLWVRGLQPPIWDLQSRVPLRREDPFEIAKLADRPLIIIPEGVDPARRSALELENARTEVVNMTMRAEAASRRIELGNRFFARLQGAMQDLPSLNGYSCMEIGAASGGEQ